MTTVLQRSLYRRCLHWQLQVHVAICPKPSNDLCLFTKRTMSSKLAKRLEGSSKNVWVEFGKLAVEHKALNLGQGFPDFHCPDYIKKALADATTSGNVFMNQYTRSYGHPRLVNALSKMFSPLLNREIDPMNEIIISCGAYGALFYAIQGLVDPGDEVIIIEPFFDCYEPMVRVAGGVPKFVPLRPTKSGEVMTSADWKLDPAELEKLFSKKTKLLILNNPNNPLGKIFTMDELKMIADLCKKYDVICISDEVYEWLVYGDNKHVRIATLPDMWERTLTIGSAGKTFSVTGWKLGWTIGPNSLIEAQQKMHQNAMYTTPTPTQEAVAIGFETELARLNQDDCYFKELCKELEPKRDKMTAFLTEVGFAPVVPEGGYVMMADFSKLNVKVDESSEEMADFQVVKWLTREKKLASIPPSVFYSKEHKHLAKNFIRFCFCKKDETLEEAEKIIKEWKKSM